MTIQPSSPHDLQPIDSFPSDKANKLNRWILFFLSLPLVGLWIFFLLIAINRDIQNREDVRRIFTFHLIILGYFFLSQLFFYLSIWIVPYFIETVLHVLIQINIVIATTGFGILGVRAWIKGAPWDWAEKKYNLTSVQNWLFSTKQ